MAITSEAEDHTTVSYSTSVCGSIDLPGLVHDQTALHEDPQIVHRGYFVDLDIPIDNWGQSEAGVIVESVLYDTPGTTEKLPNAVEFIDYDGTTTCIEEPLGRVFEICLKNGKIETPAYATILDVVIDPLDEVHWEIVWVVGESELVAATSIITTDCSQRLPILQWPDAEFPVK